MGHHNITAIVHDKRGRVLSVGKNSYVKTHPLQAFHARLLNSEHKIYLHAEIDAIVRCKDLKKAHTLSVFRYFKDGSPALARPCAVCRSAIEATNIKVVVHT
jgi:deoxycytidylate deaminase